MKNLSQEYEEVGGVITADISSATHIIGVKAPAPEELIEDKVSNLFNVHFIYMVDLYMVDMSPVIIRFIFWS